MSGGSTADTRPSRPGDRSTLSSGYSVESLQCQQSTHSSRSLFSAADVQRTILMSVCGEQRESRERPGTLDY